MSTSGPSDARAAKKKKVSFAEPELAPGEATAAVDAADLVALPQQAPSQTPANTRPGKQLSQNQQKIGTPQSKAKWIAAKGIDAAIDGYESDGKAWVYLAKLDVALNYLDKYTNKDDIPEDLGCEVCHSAFAEGANKMLLCDGCGSGWHMLCLTPPIFNFSKGDWWCSNCLAPAVGGTGGLPCNEGGAGDRETQGDTPQGCFLLRGWLPLLLSTLIQLCYEPKLHTIQIPNTNFVTINVLLRIVNTICRYKHPNFINARLQAFLAEHGAFVAIHAVLHNILQLHKSKANQELWMKGVFSCTRAIVSILSHFQHPSPELLQALFEDPSRALQQAVEGSTILPDKLKQPPSRPLIDDLIHCALVLEDDMAMRLQMECEGAEKKKQHAEHPSTTTPKNGNSSLNISYVHVSFCNVLRIWATSAPSVADLLANKEPELWKMVSPNQSVKLRYRGLTFFLKMKMITSMVQSRVQLRESLRQYRVLDIINQWADCFQELYGPYKPGAALTYLLSVGDQLLVLIWLLCQQHRGNSSSVLQNRGVVRLMQALVGQAFERACEGPKVAYQGLMAGGGGPAPDVWLQQVAKLIEGPQGATGAAGPPNPLKGVAQGSGTKDEKLLSHICSCVVALGNQLGAFEAEAAAATAQLLCAEDSSAVGPKRGPSSGAQQGPGGTGKGKKKAKKKKGLCAGGALEASGTSSPQAQQSPSPSPYVDPEDAETTASPPSISTSSNLFNMLQSDAQHSAAMRATSSSRALRPQPAVKTQQQPHQLPRVAPQSGSSSQDTDEEGDEWEVVRFGRGGSHDTRGVRGGPSDRDSDRERYRGFPCYWYKDWDRHRRQTLDVQAPVQGTQAGTGVATTSTYPPNPRARIARTGVCPTTQPGPIPPRTSQPSSLAVHEGIRVSGSPISPPQRQNEQHMGAQGGRSFVGPRAPSVPLTDVSLDTDDIDLSQLMAALCPSEDGTGGGFTNGATPGATLSLSTARNSHERTSNTPHYTPHQSQNVTSPTTAAFTSHSAGLAARGYNSRLRATGATQRGLPDPSLSIGNSRLDANGIANGTANCNMPGLLSTTQPSAPAMTLAGSQSVSYGNGTEAYGMAGLAYGTRVSAGLLATLAASVPEDMYTCPITHELMVDPVIAADGYTYERSALRAWLQGHNTSPMTNEPLEHKLLIPNRTLKSLVDYIIQGYCGWHSR